MFSAQSAQTELKVKHDVWYFASFSTFFNPCPAEYIKMPCPLLIFSQSDYLVQIVAKNSHTYWQTVQIQISWLLQKPTDLDLHCLQRSQLIWICTVCKGRVYPGSAGQGLRQSDWWKSDNEKLWTMKHSMVMSWISISSRIQSRNLMTRSWEIKGEKHQELKGDISYL